MGIRRQPLGVAVGFGSAAGLVRTRHHTRGPLGVLTKNPTS